MYARSCACRLWPIASKKAVALVNRVARGFLRLGIRAGDRVCVMVSNCPEFLYAWFGLMKIGAILVPINSAFRRTETQYIVQHAGAAAIVVEAATGPVVADIAAHCRPRIARAAMNYVRAPL